MADPIRKAALAAQPVAPSEDPSDFQTLHSIALDMVETLRPIVIPQILGVLSRAIEQSPAPTTHTPLDLDALLSPEGAYERGTCHKDGAQLLTGRHGERGQWWVPIVGCDTLDNLLDRIRSRILPHLRPPIAGIDVPGPDGDYAGLQELCDACGVDVRIGAPLLKRAREAWNAAAQPPAAVPVAWCNSGDFLVAAEKRQSFSGWRERYYNCDMALYAAQPPAPAPASDGEREELIEWLTHMAQAGLGGRDELNAAAAATLLRNPCATPVPVAVSESPYKREGWCDANGKLWCFFDDHSYKCGWQYRLPRPNVYDSHYLPHWAIPQPPHGGEVQP